MLLLEILSSFLSEAREDFIADKMGPKLVARYKADTGRSIEAIDLVHKLATAGQQQIQWIAKQYSTGAFSIDKLNVIKQLMTEFTTKQRALDRKDINQYKTVAELRAALSDTTEVKSNKERKRNATADMIESNQAKVIVNTPTFSVINPKTEEASCHFGNGTQWCTAANENNEFDKYNATNPLYIISIKGKGGQKYQLHFTTGRSDYELMDATNSEVDLHEFMDDHSEIKPIIKRLATEHGSTLFRYDGLSGEDLAERVFEDYGIRSAQWPKGMLTNVEALKYILPMCVEEDEYFIEDEIDHKHHTTQLMDAMVAAFTGDELAELLKQIKTPHPVDFWIHTLRTLDKDQQVDVINNIDDISTSDREDILDQMDLEEYADEVRERERADDQKFLDALESNLTQKIAKSEHKGITSSTIKEWRLYLAQRLMRGEISNDLDTVDRVANDLLGVHR